MVTYVDDFNRANTLSGLGSIPGGPTWLVQSGTWRILNNRAHTSTSADQNPIAYVTLNTPNASVEADLGPGDAVYSRIVDSNNWWRIRQRSWTTQSTSYRTEYEWQATYGGTGTAVGTYAWSHNHGTSINSTSWSTSNTSCPHGNSHTHSHNVPQSASTISTWDANGADSWRTASTGGGSGGWRGDNLVYQGQWSNFGRHTGLWFFNDSSIRNTLANKTITEFRIRVTRRSTAHGEYSAGIPTFRMHNYSSKPSGQPATGQANTSHGIGFSLGDTKWVNLPPTSWGTAFRDGTARGIALYTPSDTPYLQFTSSARLEITSHYPASTGGNHTHSRTSCTLTGRTRQVESGSSTTTHYILYLERSINGTITFVGSSTGLTSRARLEFDGNQVRAFKGSSTTPWWSGTSSSHNTATKFGIGRGPSDILIHHIDNFKLVVFSQPPFAPSPVSPIDGAVINGSSSQRIRWQFNTPNPGDHQSFFTLQYGRVDQATTTITRETTNNFWEAPSGTFGQGDYRWRVSTKNNVGLEGDFCNWQYFTADIPPDQASITSPANNGTITGAVFPVSWSAAEQQFFQVRVLADNNGVPGAVVYDSGQTHGPNVRTLELDFPTNNVFRHVQVRVQRNTLWSDWVSVRVSVDYTPPRPALLELSRLDSLGGVRTVVINPTPMSGEPEVVENMLQRRTDFTNWADVGTIEPNFVYNDYSVESGTSYDYRVVSKGDNNTHIESEAYAITPQYKKWFLKDPDTITDPEDHIELFMDGSSDMDIEQKEDQAVFGPLGRPDRVIVRDVIRGDRFPITVQLMGVHERRKFLQMRNRQKTLLLQSPFQQWYIAFASEGTRSVKNVVDDYEHYTIECIEQRDPFNV